MKHSVLSACLLVLCMALGSEAISCVDPRPHKGAWVTDTDGDTSSWALVTEKCSDLCLCSKDNWRRGHRVKDWCDRIPMWTAIAAFNEDTAGNSYAVRPAIFESCSTYGVWVYNQWSVPNGFVARRLLPYGSAQPYKNGNNYYVIEL
ncbi:domesticated amidase effector 2-like [Haemaphysalis longicornis]